MCADACFTKQWQKVLSSPCFCLQVPKILRVEKICIQKKICSCPLKYKFSTYPLTKGQLISKTNCQVANSSKKWTNEFVCTKGQIISKCLFGVFNFFQKTNKNTSHCSKNEFICSFFGRIHGLTICFRNQLTFSGHQIHKFSLAMLIFVEKVLKLVPHFLAYE